MFDAQIDSNHKFWLKLTGIAYLLASIFSLCAVVQGVSFVYVVLAYHPDRVEWTQTTLGNLCGGKPFEFTYYLLGCAFLGLYALYGYRLIISDRLRRLFWLPPDEYPNGNGKKQIFRICCLIFVNVLFGYTATPGLSVFLQVLFWITLFLLPTLFEASQTPLFKAIRRGVYMAQMAASSTVAASSTGRQYWKWAIPAIVLLIISIEQSCMIAPFFSRPAIMNEFLNIPETTILDNKAIDNLNYIESHHLMGINPRYDPRRDGETSPRLTSIDVFKLGAGGRKYTDLFQSPVSALDGTQAFQDPHKGGVFLDSIQQQENQLANKEPSEEETQFLRANYQEIHWELMYQGILHHQNHVFGPALEYELGKPAGDIFTQYGRLTIYLSWSLMFLMGGVTLGHLYIVSGIYQLAYLFVCMAVAWRIGRRWEYAAIIAFCYMISIAREGFLLNYLNFGYNPIRHGLDAPALLCAYEFFKNRRLWALAATLSMTLLAIFNNNTWGLMLLGGFLVALACLILQEWPATKWLPRQRWLIFGAFAFALGEVFFGLKVHFGPDVQDYFFDGGAAYYSEPGALFFTLTGIGCLAIVLPGIVGSFSSPVAYSVILWSVYCLGALLYPIWAARWGHFWSIVPILSLLFLLIVKLIFDVRSAVLKRFETPFFYLLTGFLFILNGLFLRDFLQERHDYQKIFTDHISYVWPYKRASIESTVNPDYLSDSVKLLEKYSQGHEVYILSQYDYLLTFLAGKYSAMPYSDMAHFLLTQKDVQKAGDLLKDKRPEYLFVDRDVKRIMAADLISPDSWVSRRGMHSPGNTMLADIIEQESGILYDRSIIRAFCIYYVHSLFEPIENEYEPVESSLLLTVYKRKDTVK